jgi:hypothetical protein
MNLGDAFSHDTKLDAFRRNFHAGRILYLFCGFTKPAPKEKFIVLGCATPQPRVFVINSQISEFIRRRPRLLSAQITLKPTDYDCFDHDSYIDCTQAIDYFTQPIIEKQILRDMVRIKLCLRPETIAEVIKAIEAVETIPLRSKLWMLEALRAAPSQS